MKIKNKLKSLSKDQKIVVFIIFILVLFISFSILAVQIERQRQIKSIEGKELVEYETTAKTEQENFYNIVVRVNYAGGLEKITYTSPISNKEVVINCNNKVTIAFDMVVEELKEYKIKVKKKGQPETEETILYECPKIQGEYVLKDGIYAYKPDLTGYNPDNTRYININTEGNLEPGNWIDGEEPENWYNLKQRNWANVYTENNGVEGYFVWIPRYAYKLDQDSQRSDVKFIDVYNNYKSEDGTVTKWADLKEQGYKIPEAFEFENDKGGPVRIPGYWMSKYQLSDLAQYKLDFSVVATQTSITIQNIKTNTTKDIARYTYAINGKIENTSITPDDYIASDLEKGKKVVNVTALDENGEIVGSMTRIFEPVKINEPDITPFDKDTTFYVYWDEDGIEHNEIPLSKEAPEEWYDYSISSWANIVTRNNGIESYFVWIPRYQYALDQTSQRSYVKFIEGTGNKVDSGYKIPEAFWWDNNGNGEEEEDERLTGYWMSKYQLSIEESTAKMDAQMAPGSNLIRIKDITGTVVTNAEENSTNVKYEYYLNGDKVHEGTDSKENYIYQNLEQNTMYVINIIARNGVTNEYLGATTKKIKTKEAYAPDLSAFNPDETYYIVYDEAENETRISIKEPAPDNWYDYSNQKWANIVTTANGTTSYFVWIPRYEYQILEDRGNLDKSNRRTDVNFITTDITNENCTPNYKVPEAFWWDNNGNGEEEENERLTGYWMSKYQLSE